MSLFDLKGKTALVTGGNGGIGLGMAKGLAAAGARVAIAGRDKSKNKEALKTLADAIAVEADLQDEKACRAMVEEAAGRVGDLGQEDRDDGKGSLDPFRFRLPVEGELDLAVLPGAEASGPDEHGNSATVGQATLERGQPGLSGGELVTVEKGGEAGLANPAVSYDGPRR